MVFDDKTIKGYTVKSLKEADPKEYLLYIAHALKIGAENKAKFFMWLDNNNYEIIAQEDEALDHLLKESLAVYKKSVSDEFAEIPFIDDYFFKAFEKTESFNETDIIGLSLTLLGFVSFKMKLIEEEEYLEIRDLLVPYKIMISQCKIKKEVLFENYKEAIKEAPSSVRLLSKLGKGIVIDFPDEELIKEGFAEITYDKESWEKE